MNWPKNLPILKVCILFFSALVMTACGVKGEPVPPDKPEMVGRGRPTYRRATEGISLQKHQKFEDEDAKKKKGGTDEESE